MRAALDLANLGIGVHLVERESALGGLLGNVNVVFPSMKDADDVIGPMVSTVSSNPMVRIHLGYEVRSIVRKKGIFLATLHRTDDSGSKEISSGSVIFATGLLPMDPSIIPEFGYGRFTQVMTSLEFESLLSSQGGDGPLIGPTGSTIKKVAFIQCVGSRVERRGLPYCSAVCCMGAIKNSLLLKRMDPEIDVSVLYIDIRTHGKGWEDAYRSARKAGVRFIRGQPSMVSKKPGSDRVWVYGENTLLKELYELEVDLVVLQVGLEMPGLNDGLMRSLGKNIRNDGLPSDEELEGVFVAGSAESPKDLSGCLAQGGGCAAEAAAHIARNHLH